MAKWRIPQCGKEVTIEIKKVISVNAKDGTKTVVDTKGKRHILWSPDYPPEVWEEIGPETKLKLTIGVTKVEVV